MNTIYRNRSVSTDGRFRARTVNQSKLRIKALYNFNQSGTASNFFSVQPIRNILNIIVLFPLIFSLEDFFCVASSNSNDLHKVGRVRKRIYGGGIQWTRSSVSLKLGRNTRRSIFNTFN